MPAKWTTEQREGIETVGKSLLVSAAAGSGKTSVLAERCAHLICGAADLCNVDELLVVTFTEAAAAEMKSRIALALADHHDSQPSTHSGRQLAVIDRAHVGTLHGFCSRLLRQHFHLLGVDPDFVILDADEAAMLKLEVARNLFADRYDREDDSNAFRQFVDSYGEGNDERLIHQVQRAHDTLCSVVDPQEWLSHAHQRIQDAIDLPLTDTELGRAYGSIIRRQLVSMRLECGEAGKVVKSLHNFPMYVEHLRELYKVLNHWLNVFDSHGMDALVEEAATVELPDLPRVSSKVENKDAAKARVDTVRDAMKKGPWRQCLDFTEAEWKEGLRRTLPHVETFLSLVDEFTRNYTLAKEEEGGLDFSDLERLALQALRDTDRPGISPSAVAKEYHRLFKHVLVDEYQDINEVQDAILALISRECVAGQRGVVPNLFCVGDVKQSIYRFRLAEAQRFLDRRKLYTGSAAHGKLIDLQKNFRSRAPLLEAINGVFTKLMTTDAADLNYDDTQRLKPGLDYPPDDSTCFTGAPIELHLVPKDAASTSDEDGDDAELDRTAREATVLAHRILEITGSADRAAMNVIDRSSGVPIARPARSGDIVILLRSMRFKSDAFAGVLRSAGINVHSESATGYFEATEINDVLSLLQVLDNQRQDIPLVAFLRSPLGGLPHAEENLARIRLAYFSEESPIQFYDAVAKFAAEQNDELAARLRDILAQLTEWRKLARRRPLAELLWTVYDQTGYLAFCAGLVNGEQRQANLIELHERARQFGTFRRQGLGRFLQFLEKLKNERDLGQASVATEADDAVRIMSIHRSKGLEFPIVCLPDLGKAINLQDCQGSILLDRSSGLGLQVIDEEKRIRYPSLASTVVQQRLKQQAMAEELRVLYVAMTRAKEHLILVGTCREAQTEKWTTQWAGHADALPAELVLNARSMLDWIGPAAAALAGGSSSQFEVTLHTPDEIVAWSNQQAGPAPLSSAQSDLADLKPLMPPPPVPPEAQDVIDRLNNRYTFAALAKTPATQSVTSYAKNTAIAASSASGQKLEMDRLLRKPQFLAGELTPDAADRGTATHIVLEHLDFGKAADVQAIQTQVEQMVACRKLSDVQKALVDLPAISWMMSTDVGKLLRENSKDVLRELPIYYAAPSISPANDPMDSPMIRGRLDLLVPSNGGYTVIDYKTDRVNGEALEQRATFYKGQLKAYCQAIETISGRKVQAAIIVFLHARECRRV